MLTVGSLFAGIGGIDLGLERAGMRVKWQVEIDPFCQRILAKHWPDVKRYGGIKELSGTELESVDLVCGGFPCQDVSQAAYHPAGFAGQRTGLFWEFARLLRILRPKYVLMENVPGLIDDGLSEVLGELASIGYDAEWEVLQANWFCLPHIRKRLFVVAYPMRFGWGIFEPIYQSDVEDAQRRFKDQNLLFTGNDWDSWEVLAENLRKDNGPPSRVDRNRITRIGNAVVPQVAEYIGKLIIEADRRNHDGVK